MKLRKDVRQILTFYPKIFLACHTRHVRDPRSDTLLSAHQAGILDHLDEIEGTGLNDLAKHMGVTPSTMSLAIDRLERGGYVTRDRDKGDGRRVKLLLTAAGERVRQENSVLDPELVQAMLDVLPAKQRKLALEGLSILADAASRQLEKKSLGGRR